MSDSSEASNSEDDIRQYDFASRIPKAMTSRQVHAKDRSILHNGGYVVGRKINSGTFATVHHAEKSTGKGIKTLAVKVIDTAKASPLFTEKFLMRELSIWPMLHHPHIIQVDKIFHIQNHIYVFMELACRGSVIDYIQRNGAVSEVMARFWCKGMCQALRYCHKRGVAHRDLKCDNLLLDKDLQVKVGDFGFSRYCLDPRTGTRVFSDTYCGSAAYVAPEVIQGTPYDPITADVWSAGVCTYVILNNAMPFDDSNIKKMHVDQVQRRWTFPPDVRNTLTPAAKKLVTRMLDPIPSQRITLDQILKCAWMRK